MEKLTESQYNILQVLKKLIAERGFPPTVREIGEAAHLSSPATTHFHLNKLAEKGYIEKGNGKNRTIKLLVENEFLQKDDDIVDVPAIVHVVPLNVPPLGQLYDDTDVTCFVQFLLVLLYV